jgi:hypothetical protein
MKSIHIFIISWPGQHDSAALIASELSNVIGKVSIVYSDPDPNFQFDIETDLIRRPNELFWADKFEACLLNCDSDFLMVIHADTSCHDWGLLVNKCYQTMSTNEKIGAWAPHITETHFNLSVNRIADIANSSLSIVAHLGGVVFCISSPIVSRMKQANYENNLYGWGIIWMFVAHIYTRSMIAVIDKSISVKHSEVTGYNSNEAAQQRQVFLRQLTLNESVQYVVLNQYINFNIIKNKKRND